ncbi:unnamed protein product [Rotaria sp. Silwood1]|nr:unnamed protein product [Rotaria sp. Silwood1]CAF3412617.1 unnamed protein product [Rotaria sp. Silwood1]CAF3438459.1 unnamed protein product [Rotaria sp. Silwood1]CAF3442884.1 unnamed protein product [Rotaria sp. Silwood1]CAF4554757.1 unnamed protein product [Rotaria sp. Silwood1]
MSLFDSSSQDKFVRLRPLAYPDTNLVLICFSIDCPTSSINVIQQWNPEIRYYCDSCPVILVAYAQKLAVEIKADAYMECSAKTREGIRDLLIHAARLSLADQFCLELRRKCFLF